MKKNLPNYDQKKKNLLLSGTEITADMYVYVYTHTYIYVDIHKYICIYLCVYMYVCVLLFVKTC